MRRWKQRFVCLQCAHSAWREVTTDRFSPPPDTAALLRGGFYCSACGARHYQVVQVELLAGRWTDAFQPGGMRVGLMTFDLSAERDVELKRGREQRRVTR